MVSQPGAAPRLHARKRLALPSRRALTLAAACLFLPGLAGAASEAERLGNLALGEAVYREICFSCHGITGDGKGPSYTNTMPRPQVFSNPDYMSRMTERYMYEVVKYGKLAVLRREVPDSPLKATAMPSFEEVLEEDQIRRLINFERTFLSAGPQDPEIREIFDAACATCHGEQGRGNGATAIGRDGPPPAKFVSEVQPPPADYTSRLLMERFSDAFITALIKKGRLGATEQMGFNTMNPYGHIMSDEEIWSVILYIRKTFIEGKR
ncbi:MAG: c-type cytochrome [candidate division NC10 bacterium]|nr:c-type cytochrome [candidate division NC10 bacterium]